MGATERDRPIGVFDSGVGGLTVMRALVYALPGEGEGDDEPGQEVAADVAEPLGPVVVEREHRTRFGPPGRAGRSSASCDGWSGG